MTEFWSLHFLHGLGAVAGRRCEPLRCAASCELRAAAPRCSGLVAPSGMRGMGNPAAVKLDAFQAKPPLKPFVDAKTNLSVFISLFVA